VKRFFILLTFYAVVVIILGYKVSVFWALLFGIVSIAGALVSPKIGRLGIGMMIVVLACVLYQVYTTKADVEELNDLKGQVVTFEGRLVKYKPFEEKYVLEIEKTIANGMVRKSRAKILVELDEFQLEEIGSNESIARITTYYKGLRFRSNPNVFNYKNYLNYKGIASGIRIKPKHLKSLEISEKIDLENLRILLFEKCSDYIAGCFPDEEGNIFSAFILGDKSSIDEKLYDKFLRTGTAHILTVSGLHFGMFYLLISKLLEFLRVDFRVRGKIVMLALTLVLWLVGFTASALRATMMIGTLYYVVSKERRYDMLNSLGFVAVISLIMNPFVLFQLGFQLSFGAVLSIGIIYPRVQNWWNKGNNFILSLILLSLSIQIGTLPLTMYYSNNIYLLSSIVNFLISFITALIFPLSLLTVGLSFVVPWGSVFLGKLSVYFGGLIAFVVSRGDELSGWALKVPSPKMSVVLMFYSLLFYLIFRYELKSSVAGGGDTDNVLGRVGQFVYKKVDIGLLVVIMLCIHWQGAVDCRILFSDVGQGDSALIVTEENESVLVDGGESRSSKELVQILLKNGVVKVDCAILSHGHSDHMGGFFDLVGEIEIDRFYYHKSCLDTKKFLMLRKALEERGTQFEEVDAGDVIQLKDSRFIVLSDNDYGSENENENSLVGVYQYGDVEVLFTGDSEFSSEKEIADRVEELDVDILKVAHHGSDTSSLESFVKGFSPEVAVISVGEGNKYKHPSMAVINRLLDSDVEIRRTDYEGAVIIEIKGSEYRVKSMKK